MDSGAFCRNGLITRSSLLASARFASLVEESVVHRNRLFGGVVLAALMLVGFTSVASAQAPLPVPNAFLAGVPQELGNPGGSAPGSNDFFV